RSPAFDRIVQVHVMDKDAHGRLIARVHVNDGDLSVQLLQAGLAWQYTEYSHDPVLASAEQEARRAKRGLWSEANAVPPWVWRRQSRESHGSHASPDAAAGPFIPHTSRHPFYAAACPHAHCHNSLLTLPPPPP